MCGNILMDFRCEFDFVGIYFLRDQDDYFLSYEG